MLCRLVGERRGVVAMEFALLMPILVILLFGATEILLVVRTRMELSAAVDATAELIASQKGVINLAVGGAGTLQDFCTGAKFMMRSSQSVSLALSVVSVSALPPPGNPGGTLTTAMDWEIDKACSTAATAIGETDAVSMATNATKINPSATASTVPNAYDSVIIVRGTFNYVPTFNNAPITSGSQTFTHTVAVRPRHGSVLCTDDKQIKCPKTGG